MPWLLTHMPQGSGISPPVPDSERKAQGEKTSVKPGVQEVGHMLPGPIPQQFYQDCAIKGATFLQNPSFPVIPEKPPVPGPLATYSATHSIRQPVNALHQMTWPQGRDGL